MSELLLDPYPGSLLHEGLGPLLSREQAARSLIELPAAPGRLGGVPRHVRLHLLMQLQGFHVPPLEENRLYETMDLMIRTSYRYRDPNAAATFADLSCETVRHKRPGVPAMGAAAEGPSGTGKTEAVLRSLGLYPRQCIVHESFPRMIGPHMQVVWQSVDVPPSGKSEDLARTLMTSWQDTTETARFAHLLAKERFRNPLQALEEWRQVARAHFLGILHLDEVQNFFKLQSLEKRRSRKAGDRPPELSISEDNCLKWVLTLLNRGGFPVLFSGTPDGIGALTRRLSTLERLSVRGFHPFRLFESTDDAAYRTTFLGQLSRYQYLQRKLVIDDAVAELILELSGGVRRILIALWIAAQRIALERQDDAFLKEDLVTAANTLLAPLAPAVAALRSKDPLKMERYEDLVSNDATFWPRFWGSMAGG